MRLIDADALIEDAKEQCEVLTIFTNGNEEMDEIAKILLKGLIYQTEKMPTVDPVKHGHDTQEDGYFHCSECGYGVADVYESSMSAVYVFEHGKEWNYCPNCGARMDGENT